MTDESNVPMNDQPTDPWAQADQPTADAPTVPVPTAEPTQPNPRNPQNLSWPPPPMPQGPPQMPPGAPAAPQTPPTWGSAPQGWPPPPVPPVTPPTPPPGPGFGQAPPPPPFGYTPGPPAGDPSGWNYGYGPPSWGPPPGASRAPNGPRRLVAAVAVFVLALASAGAGAAISAAVHSNDTSTASSPFTGNGSNGGGNGFGLGNGGFSLGNGAGNGNGGSSSSGTGTTPSAKVIAKVNPGVVDIYTTIDNGQGQGEAAGTGMVITPDGEVLTNNHVIDGAKTIRVQLVGTGSTHTAEVLGYSVVDDVALLKIDNVSDLATVHPADGTAQVGDAVVAIGNAGGRGGTPAATSGSVTALGQKVTAGDVGSSKSETLHGMIQISAPIEPGDSGGPLADTDGNIIGMNTAAAQSDDFFGSSGSSTAFAIPIDKALQVVHQIEDGNDSDTVHVGDRGILGVQVRNIGQNPAPTSSGALIAGVESSSPADSAGIAEGDVITSIDGKAVTNASDLTSVMFPYHPDDKVQIGWVDQSGGSHHASVGLVAGPPD